jgi:3',5'-cyclic AMP phosphodiesterase CpdA
MRLPRPLLFAALWTLALAPGAGLAVQQPAPAPIEKREAPAPPEHPSDSLRFIAFGDMGTGDKYQLAVAKQMVAEYDRDPFELVLMLGDNNYRGNFAKQVHAVFEAPYEALLKHDVPFYATLGNHDQSGAALEVAYPKYHMGGKTYYSFKPKGDLVEFFTFDSTRVVEANDTAQLDWLDKQLQASKARWKIVFIHHPPFSPGKRHGDNPILEQRLCPILERDGVRVVLTGHEHFFAQMQPKNGVDYVISGSGGKIQNGGILPDTRMAAGNDRVHQFLSITLTPDAFDYTVVCETGETIYRGTIPYRRGAASAAAP